MEKKKRKSEFRAEAIERMSALPENVRAEKSQAACRRLVDLPEIRAARAILLYIPLPDELDIWPALHAFQSNGKRVILPKCRPREREIICIEIADFQKDLARGTFNILEPKGENGIGLDEIDAIVAPARAFDHAANRLGRGAGYYDRFFIRTGLDALKCGIAFDCQIFPAVPMLPHDVPVDLVVTESALIRGDGSAAENVDE